MARFDVMARVEAATMFITARAKIKEKLTNNRKEVAASEDFLAAGILIMASLAKHFGMEKAANSAGFDLSQTMEGYLDKLLRQFEKKATLFSQVMEA